MKSIIRAAILALTLISLLLSACSTTPLASPIAAGFESPLRILAAESFLADIAQNVAGRRAHVDSLIPMGVDPHAYQPTPQDVVTIATSQVLIINGADYESWLKKSLENAGGERRLVVASQGLTGRIPSPGEAVDASHPVDPHFWLDPNHVIQYVENIRQALTQADPPGATIYQANADSYTAQLKELDAWIRNKVSGIPGPDRQLVTNHESLGYFADRYGFHITGTVIPGTSSEAAPSAQQMAALIDAIRKSGAKAIFIETGANPQLAGQIAQESNVIVVTGLYTESLTPPDGPAPTYIDMLKNDVNLITTALK